MKAFGYVLLILGLISFLVYRVITKSSGEAEPVKHQVPVGGLTAKKNVENVRAPAQTVPKEEKPKPIVYEEKDLRGSWMNGYHLKTYIDDINLLAKEPECVKYWNNRITLGEKTITIEMLESHDRDKPLPRWQSTRYKVKKTENNRFLITLKKELFGLRSLEVYFRDKNRLTLWDAKPRRCLTSGMDSVGLWDLVRLADIKPLKKVSDPRPFPATGTIFDAAYICHVPAVFHLLKKGVDINSKDKDGYTPMSFAFSGYDYKGRRYRLMKALLENGASPDCLFLDSKFYASYRQMRFTSKDTRIICCAHKQDLRLLLKYNVDINSLAGKRHPIYWQAFVNRGNPEDIELLLKSGAKVDEKDANKLYPIQYFSAESSKATRRLFIKYGSPDKVFPRR